jgi:V-type H+-transporting ATPase subunit C
LGGNAFSRDKKGRVRKDDPADMQHLGGEASEYTAFVYYELEIE